MSDNDSYNNSSESESGLPSSVFSQTLHYLNISMPETRKLDTCGINSFQTLLNHQHQMTLVEVYGLSDGTIKKMQVLALYLESNRIFQVEKFLDFYNAIHRIGQVPDIK